MAVNVQDALPYREPEFWYYSTRQSLGHALLINEDFNEAVNVFNQDLMYTANKDHEDVFLHPYITHKYRSYVNMLGAIYM